MTHSHPRRNAGFSLIELLIVVAIIAALVGVAVPFFQNNLAEAQQAKARQDLQVIRKAIAQYEQRENRLLLGASLQPLLGRYVQELPTDPWGNAYLYEGAVGFLASYGADGLPGGSGGDADIFTSAVSQDGESFAVLPIFLRRAQYQGAWGRPRGPEAPESFRTGNKVILTFTRPLTDTDPENAPGDFLYVTPLESGGEESVPFSSPTSWIPDTWKSAADPIWGGAVDPLHRPDEGRYVLRAFEDNRQEPTALAIRPNGRVSTRHPEDPPPAPLTIESTYTVGADPASPLDPTVYGPDAQDLLPEILPPPEVEYEDGTGDSGVRLERY